MTLEQRLQVLAFVAKAQQDMLERIARGFSWGSIEYWEACYQFADLLKAATD